MEKMEKFLETSLLPAVEQLIKINTEMAKTQAGQMENMVKAMEHNKSQAASMEQAVNMLSEGVASLGKSIAQLIDSVNRSNRLQEEQNRRIQEMNDTLMENTSRLGAIELGVSVLAAAGDGGDELEF